MSFIVRCPFCRNELEVPDNMLGRVGKCASCGREIDLEPIDPPVRKPAPRAASGSASNPLSMAAAMIAAKSDTMPKVTWSWAFDFVVKISVAAAVIDGFVAVIVWIIVAMLRMTGPRY